MTTHQDILRQLVAAVDLATSGNGLFSSSLSERQAVWERLSTARAAYREVELEIMKVLEERRRMAEEEAALPQWRRCRGTGKGFGGIK